MLYIRRATVLGVHTSAIVQLLQIRDDASRTQHSNSLALGRVAAPRILGRQLLCRLPSLSRDMRHLTMLGAHPFNVRVGDFVNEACDVLYLPDERSSHASLEGAVSDHDDRERRAFTLLEETEAWLSEEPTVPRPDRVQLQPHGILPWPFFSAKGAVRVHTNAWVIRDWVIYHMCRIRILEAVVAADLGDTLTHLARIHESCSFLLETVPILVGALKEDSIVYEFRINDIGIMVAQYPLWLIRDSRNAPDDARQAAAQMLAHIAAQRGIEA
ncbi:hypothetical protein BAUCODRAFT_565716 [Baudoinia panamericana UAMH 10762]|uniref:Uncharacterized protein n=1 Tax=Baudoinia panamericana (strain UAMH 10762) TaxID=717646 RepID=M2N731_BAUPA|nr:uncharacterized protein BAUCODRAFT_565716 [Baudoinia panamericana UAMH 10762]EMC94884.1 hypothetical protein BAUCODRAFT_565716 [Baudoinia panamericana UAMH 10762]